MIRTALLTLILLAATVRAAERPNFVVILADDLGWSDLGCHGNRYHETPRIDRLAGEGIRFTQGYAGPVCSPTRANLQTGRDQARYGITQHIPGHRRPFARLIDPEVPPQLPLEAVTYAERLAGAGYRTAYFGKWHLGGEGHGPEDQGWETVLECQGHRQPAALTGTGAEARTADLLADRAVAFMEAHREEPFVVQISHYAVHIPLSTTPGLLAKYEAKPPLLDHPCLPAYAGLLEELDRSVGKVVDAVDRLGLSGRTLVLFLSDNGGLEHEQGGRLVTSNRPLRGEKGTLYEGGIRIPFLARWPGVLPAGVNCDVPVSTQDIHPTLLALAGLPPAASDPPDGADLSRLLRQPGAPSLARSALYWHLPHYHHSSPAGAIRRGDWKLIEWFEDGALELYHLPSDPGEASNLAPREPTLARDLLADLRAWQRSVGARLPVPNPAHDPSRAGELGGRRRR